MFKKLLFVAVAITLLASCNTQNKDEVTAVTSTEFATVAENLVDQIVTIEGTVLHVCKHGGKKMFISDDRIKIIASEKLASFDVALEGSDVMIKGIIREEAVPVLAENEQKLHADSKVTEEAPVEASTTDKAEMTEAEAEAAACSMEEVKPLYVIEIVEVTEKVQ